MLHEQAIAEDPENGSFHAHFVRNLIARGLPEIALEEIGRAFELLPETDRPSRMQLLFYEVAIGDQGRGDAALVELHRLIEIGMSLSTWSFQPVIEFCENSGNPDAQWLATLAEVIGGREEMASLDSWPRWRVH